jgi:hypothetical protein
MKNQVPAVQNLAFMYSLFGWWEKLGFLEQKYD